MLYAKVAVRGPDKHGSFWLDYYSHDGRRRRPRVGDSRGDAEETAIMFRRWLRQGHDPERELERTKRKQQYSFKTLRELFPEFYENHEASEGTRESYRSSFNALCRTRVDNRWFVDLSLTEIDKPLMQDYMSGRIKHNGVKPRTAIIEARLVSVMMTYAANKGYIQDNPLRGLSCPKVRDRREVRLTAEQVASLVNALKSDMVRRIVLFALYTGRRKNEILNMRVEDVAFDCADRMVRYYAKTKGGRRRSFIASDLAAEVLKEIIGNRTEGLVFESPRGGTYYSKIDSFSEAVTEAGLTDIVQVEDGTRDKLRFHDLRHVFATELTDAGADIRDVQALLDP